MCRVGFCSVFFVCSMWCVVCGVHCIVCVWCSLCVGVWCDVVCGVCSVCVVRRYIVWSSHGVVCVLVYGVVGVVCV